MKTRILLVSSRLESNWATTLRDTLGFLGSLDVFLEDESKRQLLQKHYDLIIIDAGSVPSPAQLVAHMRAQESDARVVVVTLATTWREAREVFRAGAIDYFQRSMPKEEFVARIHQALQLPLST